MTGPEIAAVVLAVVAAAEAVGLVTLWVMFTRARDEVDELRVRVDTRSTLLSGGREAVKHMWQTANLVREKGFGGAISSSIEELADWFEVERPDLARLAPNGRVAILFSDIEESTALNNRPPISGSTERRMYSFSRIRAVYSLFLRSFVRWS